MAGSPTDTTARPPAGAVFLSYAREDADLARRIAEALRAFGVEVWFDQNELRGGDAWDTKIRTQIKTCALFVPIVSQRTEDRPEGYFRREWKLAVDRTQDMGSSRAFIVPIVIDETKEAGADVPEEFMRYQWTRLPRGVPTPQFVEQVKKLLEAPRKAAAGIARPTARDEGGLPAAASGEGRGASPTKPSAPWLWPAAVVILGIGALALWLLLPSRSTKSVAVEPTAGLKPTGAAPAPPVPLAPAKSLAVLPFVNMSPDKENEFFADGVHEDVITNLAKIRDLKVISRTSVLAYRDTASRNLKKIAAELGVATVLEGSVRRVGTKVRVTAQLIDARTDEHLWAETYDRDLTDVFTIQSALAQEIANALRANFTVGERALVGARITQNAEAYDLYLKARALWESPGANSAPGSVVREVTERTIALYEEAVARDPMFGAAYAQLTYLHGRMYWYEYLDPTPARKERAKAALDATVKIAPDRPETHLALGAYTYYADNDWQRALNEFHASEVGLPNDAQLQYFLGLTYRRLGRFDESIAHFNRSLELSPRDFLCANQLQQTYTHVRRYAAIADLAARYLTFFPGDGTMRNAVADARFELDHDTAAMLRAKEALAAERGSGVLEYNYFWLAMMQGDFVEAERALAAPKLKTIISLGALLNEPVDRYRALVAFLRGDRERARVLAGQAMEYYRTHTWISRQAGAVKLGMAMCHAYAGQADQALALAREAYEWQLTRDVFVAQDFAPYMAEIYFVLGRDEDLLKTVQTMVTQPCSFSPGQIRLWPIFAKVKTDPRFEEFLKQAKPL